LYSSIKKFGNFSEEIIINYIKQVLIGLDYLHSNNVIHRDIKGDNILLTKEGEVKLADFGVSVILEQSLESKSVSFAGTPYWMAPEVIQGHKVTTTCDIWSLACTIIELLTGKPPFYDLQQYYAFNQIVKGEPTIPENISEDLKNFLKISF